MNPKVLRWVGLALAIFAGLLSNSLLGLHALGTSDLGLLAGICGKTGAGCNAVISSRWGVFPPGPEKATEEGSSKAGAVNGTAVSVPEPRSGIPVAAMGLFYYTFLAAYLALVGRPSWSRRRVHAAILAVFGFGLLGSLFYLGVMLFALDKTCILCIGTHLCNFLLAPVLWSTRPREPNLADEGGGLSRPELAHPDLRLGLAVVALTGALCAAEWNGYRSLYADLQGPQIEELRIALGEVTRDLAEAAAQIPGVDPNGTPDEGDVATLRAELAQARKDLEEYEELANDLERMDGMHLNQEALDLEAKLGIRPDDPKIERDSGRGMNIVVFSDIECPNCAAFHEFLFDELVPLFRGHLTVVFKHFPLNIHPYAVPGAKALEAARLQGNDKYWEMHHYLAERRASLGSVNYTDAAASIGLDVNRFVSDMVSPEVARRIQEDVTIGQRLGLRGTPAVFLNGRLVNRVIRRNIGWWKIKADVVRDSRARSGQPW